MIIAGIGAGMFIVAGTQNASMQKLLKEGDFTEKEKKRTSGNRKNRDPRR